MYAPDQGGADPRSRLLAAIQAARGQNGGGYVRPTDRIAALRQMLSGQGEPDAAVNANIQNGANAYAQKRLGQFGKVADEMGGDFAKAYHSQDMSDPAAAYRALSGQFAHASQDQGVADPRMLLMQLLQQTNGGRAQQSQGGRAAVDPRSAALNAKYGLGQMQNAYTDGRKLRG